MQVKRNSLTPGVESTRFQLLGFNSKYIAFKPIGLSNVNLQQCHPAATPLYTKKGKREVAAMGSPFPDFRRPSEEECWAAGPGGS